MAKVKQPVSIDGIEFDALINQTTEYTADVPAYPTEEGYSISDTVILKPEILNMTLFVTNTPVTWLYRNGGGTGHLEGIISRLQQVYFSRKVVTVVTGDSVYENMVIESLSLTKSADVGYAREIPITLKKVIITQSGAVQIPDEYGKSGTTMDGGNANSLNGEGNGPNSSSKSLLKGITDSLGWTQEKSNVNVSRSTDPLLKQSTSVPYYERRKNLKSTGSGARLGGQTGSGGN